MTDRSSAAALLAEARAEQAEIDAVLAQAEEAGGLLPAISPRPATSPQSGQEVRIVPRPGESAADALARVSTSPFVPGAATVCDFTARGGVAGALAPFDAVARQLEQQAADANAGNLTQAEAVLAVHVVSLDAMFNALARKATANIDRHADATERYLRMALRAQAQCRATVETLAAIKNGPVVFGRQANINNGGQQQVNNGGAAPAPGPAPRTRTRGKGKASRSNELLGGGHGERLDT